MKTIQCVFTPDPWNRCIMRIETMQAEWTCLYWQRTIPVAKYPFGEISCGVFSTSHKTVFCLMWNPPSSVRTVSYEIKIDPPCAHEAMASAVMRWRCTLALAIILAVCVPARADREM